MTTLQIFFCERLGQLRFDLVFPGGFVVLVFFEDVGILAGVPAGTVCAILLDQIGSLAEPPVVFGVVPTRFCDVVSQCQIHLVAYLLFVIHFRALCDGLVNQWVGVYPIPFVFEIPCLVVDSCTQVINFIVGRTNPISQHHGSALYRVAQPRDLDEGLFLDGGDQHGHRIGVVEQHSIWADLFHIMYDIHHIRQGT